MINKSQEIKHAIDFVFFIADDPQLDPTKPEYLGFVNLQCDPNSEELYDIRFKCFKKHYNLVKFILNGLGLKVSNDWEVDFEETIITEI